MRRNLTVLRWDRLGHLGVASMRQVVSRCRGPANHQVVGPTTQEEHHQGAHPMAHHRDQGASHDQVVERQASKARVAATWVGRLGQVVATLVLHLGRVAEGPKVVAAKRRASWVVRLDAQASAAARGPTQAVVRARHAARQVATVRCPAFYLDSLRHDFGSASACRGPEATASAAYPSLLRTSLLSPRESRRDASPTRAATSAPPPEKPCKRNAHALMSSSHYRQARLRGGTACWLQPHL